TPFVKSSAPARMTTSDSARATHAMVRHPTGGAPVACRPMDPRAFLDTVAIDDGTPPSLLHVRELPARTPVPEPLPSDLPALLTGRLELAGIEGLYANQARGLESLRAGHNVVMATGT